MAVLFKFKGAGKGFSNISGKSFHRYDAAIGTMGDTIRSYMTGKCYSLMMAAKDNAAWNLGKAMKYNLGYSNVTGNLSASMGVAVVGVNPKSNHLTVSQSAPINYESGVNVTRNALRMGEVYGEDDGLTKYADGYPVVKGRGYRGETNLGAGENGRNLRMQYVNRIRQTGYQGNEGKMYTLYAFMAMPYASYVNMKNPGGDGHNTNNFFRRLVMPLVVDGMRKAIEQQNYERSLE